MYVPWLALCLAILEIQIEGKYGWAEKLPCWRKTDFGKIFRFFNEVINDGRPLTGYHLALNLVWISVWHLTFIFIPWNAPAELFICGVIMLFYTLEDFLWFVFNPHYGIRKFKKGGFWWHKTWLGPVPSWYVAYIVGASILIFFGIPGIG